MEPDINGSLQGSHTGKGGARWFVIVILLLLFAGFMAWFWWSVSSQESQRQGADNEGVTPTKPVSLELDGLELILGGETVSRVDLTPAVSQLVQNIYNENKQKEEAAAEATTETGTTVTNNTITQVFNTQGSPQKLSIDGQMLTISDGNTVTLPSDGDGVVGNEITDVIASAGLQRTGAGTAADPFKVGMATCASGEVLQSSGGGVWACAVVGGSSYTADGQGIELVGTQFQLELNGTTLSKSSSGLNLNLSNANTWGALQTFGAGLTLGAAQTLTVNGDAFTDLTGTGLTISGGALQTTLGTAVDLASEVSGILPVTNGGTGTNTAFTQGSIIFAGASGVYSQDNANFFWDDTNNRLGLGTTTPDNRLTINGDFNIRDADTATKQYRFRTSGGALDFEGAGADMHISVWSGADFTGTQRNKLMFEAGADITQAIKLWQFRDSAHGTLRHYIDGSVAGGVHFNDNGEATNLTVEGDTDAALLFVQGSTDRVSIGGLGPSAKLHISSDQAADLFKVTDATATAVDVMRIADEGAITFRNRTDSTGAFTILNAASSTLFNVDSSNTRVGVGGVASFSLFEVIGGDAAIYNNGNNPRLILGDSTAGGENGYLQWDSANNYFRIESVGTNGLKINDNFVTIGNVFPDRPLRVAIGTTTLFDVSTVGAITAQNSTNSTAAFNLKNAAGNNLFTVDTTNGRVGVSLGGSNLPQSTLHLDGTLRISGTTTESYLTPAGLNVPTKINIPSFNPGNFGQLVAMGLPSTASSTARALSLFDARTGAHQPTLAVFDTTENNLAGFSWEGTSTTAYLKTTGGNWVVRSNTSDLAAFESNGEAGVGTASTNPTAAWHVASDVAARTLLKITDSTTSASDVLTIADEGATTFKNRTDSTSAFQVQNAAATSLFSVDATNSRVYVGNPTADSTGTLLVLDTKNTAGDPTGVNGGMYYNSNTGKMRCHENGLWKNCLGPIQNLTLFGMNGDGSASQWLDMPAAETEFFVGEGAAVGVNRILYDFSQSEEVRFQVNVDVVGAASSEIRIQYSTDQVTWNYLDSGNTGLGQNLSTTGFKTSAWSDIAAGAQGEVYLRMTGINGDGATDPQFGLIQLQAR